MNKFWKSKWFQERKKKTPNHKTYTHTHTYFGTTNLPIMLNITTSASVSSCIYSRDRICSLQLTCIISLQYSYKLNSMLKKIQLYSTSQKYSCLVTLLGDFSLNSLLYHFSNLRVEANNCSSWSYKALHSSDALICLPFMTFQFFPKKLLYRNTSKHLQKKIQFR